MRADRPAGLRAVAGRGIGLAAPALHHQFAIRFLFETAAHHVHGAFHAIQVGGEGKRAAPLPRARFGGQVVYAFHFVEVGLGDGGVGFVAARGRYGFVFVVDARGSAEGFFQAERPVQRRGAPCREDAQNIVGNIDPWVHADFLHDQAHGENRAQVVRSGRLFGQRMQGRRRRDRQVRRHIVPALRDVFFMKQDFAFHGCRCPFDPG
ncbi:MAG: hypothetical protein BWZ10_00881 [candidate division BRC1 bacterium ADurb.BinA364]|nr:MAG: hypothetical protein BWZ10_00881 [candidate division BRC1 bacterium ADurb.BinA364]